MSVGADRRCALSLLEILVRAISEEHVIGGGVGRTQKNVLRSSPESVCSGEYKQRKVSKRTEGARGRLRAVPCLVGM